MSPSKMESSSSSNTSRGLAGSSSARTIIAANCPLVTFLVSQYQSFCGGLHPRVMPASAMALMSRWKIDELSSMKKSTTSTTRVASERFPLESETEYVTM